MNEPEQIYPLPDERFKAQVVILANGVYPIAAVEAAVLANAGAVICCDGAAGEFVGRGGIPAAIVGDCDSVSEEIKERFSDVIHCDKDQETNDLTKAVEFCLASGYDDITILGATGKREDHTIGNFGLLADYGLKCRKIRMITPYGVFDPIYKDSWFESFAGQQVSVFTLNDMVRITTHNLLYPLHEARLDNLWQGTLNQSLEDTFGIGTDGSALVFRLFGRK